MAIPEQTATGKEMTNPFMAGRLPKTTCSCVAELLIKIKDQKSRRQRSQRKREVKEIDK